MPSRLLFSIDLEMNLSELTALEKLKETRRWKENINRQV